MLLVSGEAQGKEGVRDGRKGGRKEGRRREASREGGPCVWRQGGRGLRGGCRTWALLVKNAAEVAMSGGVVILLASVTHVCCNPLPNLPFSPTLLCLLILRGPPVEAEG